MIDAKFIFAFVPAMFVSCTALNQIQYAAKFEQATGYWFEKPYILVSSKDKKVCRIENLKAIHGNGRLVVGYCDGIPHVYAEKDGKIIDLTATCQKFDKTMEITVKDYEITAIKIFKDRSKYYPEIKELYSFNTINFFYIKSALEYLKEKQCEKFRLYSKECLLR
ncbi:hypothetical protein [Persephonella sp.]